MRTIVIRTFQQGNMMSENIIAEPTECPYYLISRATLVVTAALKRDLASANAGHVSPAYLGVLMSLWNEDGLKVGELGRRAGLEPSTMTGLLDRMARDGLLERRADPNDRRAQRIHLTEPGRTARGPVSEVVNRTLDRMLEGVPDKDISHLKETLKRLLSNYHKVNTSHD